MRRKPVSTEKLFWSMVRNRQLAGYKFKRQVPLGPYIVDFLCPFHAARAGYDKARDVYLRGEGFNIIRLTNKDFAGDPATMLMMIKRELEMTTPSP